MNFSQRIIAILAFALFTNLFFFRPLGSIAFALLALGLFTFLLVLFHDQKLLPKLKPTYGKIFLILFLASLILIKTANFWIALLLGATGIFPLMLLAYLTSAQIPFVRSLMELALVPINLGFSYLGSGLKVLQLFLPGNSKSLIFKKSKGQIPNLQSLIVGILIGLPIIALLISFLAGADPVFFTLVKNIITEEFIKRLPLRFVFTLITVGLLSPLIFLARKKEFFSPFNFLERFSFAREMSVIMSLVAIILAVFLIVQSPYVFANVPFETDLSRFGVPTYSEYVKKGFWELLQATLFTFGLIWVGLTILRGGKKGQKTTLPAIQLVVLAELLILIFSTFRRIWLYQQYHGWSLARIYGGFWLIWLVGMTLTLAVRHYWQKKWVLAETIFTILLILTVGAFNAEHFLATTHPPTVNQQTDYVYLARLSADGYQGWQKAYQWAEKILLKSDLENKSLIGEEERREIAYAGVIVRQLTHHYHQLIRKHGTEKENSEYLKAVLAFQKQANENFVARIEKAIRENQTKELPPNPDPLLAHAQEEQQRIKEASEKLNSIDDLDKLPLDIGFSYSPKVLIFEKNPDKNYTLFGIYSNRHYKPFGKLDQLLTWNWSEAKAYRQIKEEISYQKLLLLQEKYWQLYQKVLDQPEVQRDFEVDISLSSPFLAPL